MIMPDFWYQQWQLGRRRFKERKMLWNVVVYVPNFVASTLPRESRCGLWAAMFARTREGWRGTKTMHGIWIWMLHFTTNGTQLYSSKWEWKKQKHEKKKRRERQECQQWISSNSSSSSLFKTFSFPMFSFFFFLGFMRWSGFRIIIFIRWGFPL